MPIYDDEILEKGAGETVSFGIDFTNWLDDETISSIVSLTSDKADLTISSEEISGGNVNFILSEGTCGIYTITCKIVTSESRIYEVSVKLRIR